MWEDGDAEWDVTWRAHMRRAASSLRIIIITRHKNGWMRNETWHIHYMSLFFSCIFVGSAWKVEAYAHVAKSTLKKIEKWLRDVGYHTKKSIFLDFWETHKINFSAFLEFLITEYRLPVGYHWLLKSTLEKSSFGQLTACSWTTTFFCISSFNKLDIPCREPNCASAKSSFRHRAKVATFPKMDKCGREPTAKCGTKPQFFLKLSYFCQRCDRRCANLRADALVAVGRRQSGIWPVRDRSRTTRALCWLESFVMNWIQRCSHVIGLKKQTSFGSCEMCQCRVPRIRQTRGDRMVRWLQSC